MAQKQFRTTRRVRSLERATRVATARQFLDRRVELQRTYLLDPELIRGQVIAVAISTGGGSDVLVLKVERWRVSDRIPSSVWLGETVALSLAQIDWIQTLPEVK